MGSLLRGLVGVGLAGLVSGAGLLHGQNPPPPPPLPPLPGAVVRDTVEADTVDRTARLLDVASAASTVTPVLPTIGTERLFTPHALIVFDQDSIDWTNAETVGDLVARVPGAFLWRGGWLNRAEMPSFRGRGASSISWWLDGVPLLPLGPDSVSIDATLFPLSMLERVEVERLPGELRVHLYTPRHARRAPRSRIGVAAGDFEIARFQGSLERRGEEGFGFGIGVDHISLPATVGPLGSYENNASWFQASYLPNPRMGVLLQLYQSRPEREPQLAFGSLADTIDPGVDGNRTDLLLRGHWRRQEDGLGPRLDLILSRSSWSSDSLNQGITQVGAIGGWRSTNTHLGFSGFLRSDRTPLDLRLTGGAARGRILSATAEAAFQRHDGGRTARWLLVRVGADLPLGFTAAGVLRTGRVLAVPSDTADEVQSVSERSLTAGWESKGAGFEVEYAHTGAFRGRGFQQFRTVPTLSPVPSADWITFRGRVAPKQWLTLEGWVSDPVQNGVEGTPPEHMVGTATIRSKFLRTFRSGIFDLKLQVGFERWGQAVMGRLEDGTAILLPSATHVRAQIQLQFDSFIAFWDRSNLQSTENGFVPGFRPPSITSTFGVRWRFLN